MYHYKHIYSYWFYLVSFWNSRQKKKLLRDEYAIKECLIILKIQYFLTQKVYFRKQMQLYNLFINVEIGPHTEKITDHSFKRMNLPWWWLNIILIYEYDIYSSIFFMLPLVPTLAFYSLWFLWWLSYIITIDKIW